MLPVMLQTAEKFKTHQFVIAGAPSQDAGFYNEVGKNHDFKIVFNKTYELLQHSTAGLVTSGTATLEAALFNVPQVVCYKGNALSYAVAKRLIKVKYISLVNLVLDKEVVKELIQGDLNLEKTSTELDLIVNNKEYRAKMLDAYTDLRNELGNAGASDRTAKMMLNYLQND